MISYGRIPDVFEYCVHFEYFDEDPSLHNIFSHLLKNKKKTIAKEIWIFENYFLENSKY